MFDNNEVVKLVPNSKVKEILLSAKKLRHIITPTEEYFIVRDNKTSCVMFTGIKIRSDLWGLTFKSQLNVLSNDK